MPDDPTPTVEKVVETKETTRASTEASAAEIISPTPAVIVDDGIRWYLAFTIIVQFILIVGYIIYSDGATDNAEMMVLGAEISFVSSVLNYFFGSSSGSTAKSALLEKSK